jgi:hypothetical protein
MDAKISALEHEIGRLREEVAYWHSGYNKAMSLFLRATELRVLAESKLALLQFKLQKTRKRKK